MPERHVTRNRAQEVKVYGESATRALFLRRPDDILRVYLTEEMVKPARELLAYCARTRKPYRVVAAAEVEAVTESRHHEGLCIVAKPRPAPSLAELVGAPGPACLLALAGVENPHNLGAIVRAAAHFGVRGVLLCGAEARLAGAAARVAQGGAEWVDVLHASDAVRALAACRAAGFVVLATSSHEGRSLWSSALPARVVFLLGAEGEGLAPALMQAADAVVSIPGTRRVESLNVAAAAAVLAAEHARVHGVPA